MNSKMGDLVYKKTYGCGKQMSGFHKLKLFAKSPALALAAILVLSGCNTQQVLVHGAVVTQDQVDLVPVGSSREQVLLSLGTPSTTGTFDNEVFYYISQNKTRKYAFQKGKITSQKVFAVYFDEDAQVGRLANYGLQDGKVFDFISRTTPTGGKDRTFLGQLLAGGSARPNIF